MSSDQLKTIYKNVLTSTFAGGAHGPLIGRESEMMPNRGGGFGFILPDKQRVERIIILGQSNGYYVGIRQDVTEAVQDIIKMIGGGKGAMILSVIKDVYENGRASKMDPLFMVLATLARSDKLEIRRGAFEIVKLLRTLSHLYSFLNFYKSAGSTKGWGRLPKKSINAWICKFQPRQFLYQVFKYLSRQGWTMRDILRCTHPDPVKLKLSKNMRLALEYVVSKKEKSLKTPKKGKSQKTPKKGKRQVRTRPEILTDIMKNRNENNEKKGDEIADYLTAIFVMKSLHEDNTAFIKQMVKMIYDHRLPREIIPTWGLKHIHIWEALLMSRDGSRVTMPMTALIRNLGVMTSKGVFDNASLYGMRTNLVADIVSKVCQHLTNATVIQRSRIHPASILLALFTYKQGRGTKGSLTWSPNRAILASLEAAFYESFGNVTPSGKRIFHGFDGSPSMTTPMANLPGITSTNAVALMGMLFARIEPAHTQKWGVFSSATTSGSLYGYGYGSHYSSRSTGDGGFKMITLTKHMTLEQAGAVTQLSNWAGTDPSLIIKYAIKMVSSGKWEKKTAPNVFIIYTDNDINQGLSPVICLREYRRLIGDHTVKLCCIATTCSRVSIADPTDAGMMDFCGFDKDLLKHVYNFIAGKL
uniref:TROVE domain protein n=1 Tax=Mimivirus LCMiAC01 TaxID=2506608 RepID=A0A481Z1Z8_9VIRU|nr:MAG: TROVE domain protein [Mimivirus LCMiAC01]